MITSNIFVILILGEDIVLNAGSPMEVSSGTQDGSQTSAHPCLISRLLEGAARAMQDETLAGDPSPLPPFQMQEVLFK